ncbi:MAG: BatA domain-containing protein [Planctomycetota bacterium]
MFSWFLNPWMLLGGLAIASPILIHLLNKRRFKIVEWAAMDFLFEADKKNRRRVEIENLILLLLRCLAMLLIAVMLARPFLPSEITSVLQQAKKLERVIVLDDSLSQQVRRDNITSFETAKSSLKELVARFAESDKTEDWLTVMLTSDPEVPIVSNEPITMNTISTINQTIDEIQCSDKSADYSETINVVSRYVSGQRQEGGRAVYLFSDMRRRDWIPPNASDPDLAPNRLINSVADAIEGFFVIDTGGDNDQNLSVVNVRPENLLVADKVIPFVVTVANHGSSAVEQVRVLFQVDDGQPDYETIPSIGPGETRTVSFRHVFPRLIEEDPIDVGDSSSREMAIGNYRVRAEIDRQSLGDNGIQNDQLLDDSAAFYASRVADGVRVLLVDGDPSAISERSETHYLKSLDVTGTGLDATVATVTELETVSLSDFQVIFLCNVDEASADRVRSLEQWVRDGGAIVFMPGDRVRARTFNETFYRDGQGICPLQLDEIKGDPTMASWVNFEIDPQVHPSLQLMIDSDAASLNNVDVFSWWTSSIDESLVGKTVSIPIRLTDEKNSVAMVDRVLGKGNVIVFTFPGDGDWSMWPISPTFPPVMLELVDYLVGSASEASVVNINGEINLPVDISAFENRVAMRNPNNEKVESVAAPANDSGSADSVIYQVSFEGIDRRGFYEVILERHSGDKESVLFATNVQADEGQLRRMANTELEGDFFNDKVSLVTPEKLAEQTVKGGSSEIWMWLLMLLFGVLMVEQFLAWFWGKRR